MFDNKNKKNISNLIRLSYKAVYIEVYFLIMYFNKTLLQFTVFYEIYEVS